MRLNKRCLKDKFNEKDLSFLLTFPMKRNTQDFLLRVLFAFTCNAKSFAMAFLFVFSLFFHYSVLAWTGKSFLLLFRLLLLQIRVTSIG